VALTAKAYGRHDLITASNQNTLASLLMELGDLAGARELAERSLKTLEKKLGPNHWLTARTLCTLGNLLDAQGDIAKARALYAQAVEIFESGRALRTISVRPTP